MRRALAAAAAVGVALSCAAGDAAAQEASIRSAVPLSEREIDERLAWLEPRIASERRHAEIWWGSWAAIYSAGLVVQAGRLGLADDGGERAVLIIDSVKATGALVRHALVPHDFILGLDALDSTPPGGGYAQKLARLRRAERVMEYNAERVRDSHAWYTHALNVGINLLGAVIAAAAYDEGERAAISAATGIVMGELVLFSQPWSADDDLAEYRAGIGRRAAQRGPEVRLAGVPGAAGLSLDVRF